MKQFLKWLGKHIAGAMVFSLFSILFISFIVYALNYPSTPPTGEVAGGKFMMYFDRMLVNTGATTDGTVRKSVTTEQIGTLTDGKWCKVVSGKVECVENSPTWVTPAVIAASIGAIGATGILWDGIGEKCSQNISGLNGPQYPGNNTSWVSNAKICVRISGSQVQVRLTHGTACIGGGLPAYDSGWVNGTSFISPRKCYNGTTAVAYGWIDGVSAQYEYFYNGWDNGWEATENLYNHSKVQY